MENKLCFVQFTHPGGEHQPDKGKDYKSWNTGKHQRKFMLIDGDVVTDNCLISNMPLLIWGEWEPGSKIVKTFEQQKGDYPKYIHRPYLDISQPFPRQNTDPYVFGSQFHYCCCKQCRGKNLSQLARLEKGSIILFGSTINQNKTTAYFALDTVFVVGSYIAYNHENAIGRLKGNVSDEYFEITIKSIYDDSFPEQNIDNLNPQMRCYYGASYDNPVYDMYSFVPAKIYNDDNCGFERVKLTNADITCLTNNLNAAPKITSTIIIADNIGKWQKLKEILRNQGFSEGVRFTFDSEDSTSSGKIFENSGKASSCSKC